MEPATVGHVVAVGDPNPDLVDRLSRIHRRTRGEHVADGTDHHIVEVARCRDASGASAGRARGQHADDLAPEPIDTHLLADRIAVPEQNAPELGTQHADGRVRPPIERHQEPPARDLQVEHRRVLRGDAQKGSAARAERAGRDDEALHQWIDRNDPRQQVTQ